MSSVSQFDHLQPSNTDYSDGIYRVVGTTEEEVTLLRVADADGRRIHTGELITVTHQEIDRFVPAENPDGNRPLERVLASKLETAYWSVRVFGRQLVARPLLTTITGILLAVGLVGERFVLLPDFLFGGLILVGSLGLAYVGSGRLAR